MKKLLPGITIAVAWVYLVLLYGWFALYLFTGDRIGYVGLANYVAQWFFLPLPLVLFTALAVRRRSLWTGLAAAVLIFLWLWGGLFLPRPAPARAAIPTLRVMTYNVLGMHGIPAPSLGVIRAVAADVVFIQELSPQVAAAINAEMADLYPYQVLDPGPGPIGMGLISKVPLVESLERLPLDWVGRPQIYELDWAGETILLVNFHTYSTRPAPLAPLNNNFRLREAQAQALADLAARLDGPLIVAGDANASPLNDAYKIIDRQLDDAWAQAGFGFGHTFPGSDLEVSDRPRVFGIPLPQWLWRIDYVFASRHWQVSAAHLTPFDGYSDHRGVIAELVLSVETLP